MAGRSRKAWLASMGNYVFPPGAVLMDELNEDGGPKEGQLLGNDFGRRYSARHVGQ